VADVRRWTQAAYHYAIRQTKKKKEAIKRHCVAASMLQDGKRIPSDWRLKRMRCSSAATSRIVDGLTYVGETAQLFAASYRKLYASVPCNFTETQEMLSNVGDMLADTSTSSECIFNVSDVKDVVSRPVTQE
jgi:hypothetical protein